MTEVEKYMHGIYAIDQAKKEVAQAQQNYALSLVDSRDDITKRQAKDEFWQVISEHFGFEIKWNRDPK